MILIPEPFLKAIAKQARAEYPRECCGMLLGPASDAEEITRLRPCINAQDEHHKLDAKNFPRTSHNAFFIGAQELLEIHKELRENGEAVRIFYHSHPDAEAYFSEEDARMALSEGGPAYPGVRHLVVAVTKSKVKEIQLFEWNALQRQFVSVPFLTS